MIYIISILLMWMTFLYVRLLFKNKKEFLEKQWTENNIFSFKEKIIISLRDSIKRYAQYEAEHGILLPKEFKSDPAAWLDVLRLIEYAFDELFEEYSTGYVPHETNQEEMAKRKEKIQKGLELFGKYLKDLN